MIAEFGPILGRRCAAATHGLGGTLEYDCEKYQPSLNDEATMDDRRDDKAVVTTTVANKPSAKPPKRVMHPCVSGYSITEERMLKSEVRQLGQKAIDSNVPLSNGVGAWTFCRDYVIASRGNRRIKAEESKRKRQHSVKRAASAKKSAGRHYNGAKRTRKS